MKLRNWRPLPELTPDEQDDYAAKPLAPLADDGDEAALDADINDFIRFNERLNAKEGNDDE